MRRELFASASVIVALDHTVQWLAMRVILALRGHWKCQNLLVNRTGAVVLAPSGREPGMLLDYRHHAVPTERIIPHVSGQG